MTIADNPRKHRFEVDVKGRTAFLNYRIEGQTITFTHTEVPAALEGRGIGTALVKAGLDHARAARLQVVPQCPFVAKFIDGQPQYRSLLG